MQAHTLREEFFQSLDHAAIQTLIEKIKKAPEATRRNLPNFLGEGSHFQSFSVSTSPLPLAINIAKSNFMALGPGHILRWRNALRDLRTIDNLALVPPMEIFSTDNYLAIAMPLGRPSTSKQIVSREILDLLNDTAQALGRAGLVLDDYPQLVECKGRYFINDWSDLKSAS